MASEDVCAAVAWAGLRLCASQVPRGHYELGVDEAATLRVAAAFDELALAI